MNRKHLCLVFMACILISLVGYAESSSWHTISNVFEAKDTVSPGLPLTITPGIGGPMPRELSTGVPYNIPISVQNPNNYSVNGLLQLNITRPRITTSDVYVHSPTMYSLTVIYEGTYNNQTLVFRLEVGGGPYFRFDPGLRINYTAITIQYNTPGNYTWDLAIIR